MNKKIRKFLNWISAFAEIKRVKHEGSAMLIAIFLSGLILTMGMASSRMLVKEVSMSAQLWSSEQAYFSAESGIENALLLLEKNPVEFLENGDILKDLNEADRLKVDLSIENHQDNFSFILPRFGNKKFRMILDTDASLNANNIPINSIGLKVESVDKSGDSVTGSANYIWKILCSNTAGQTISIQKEENGTNEITNILTATGKNQDNVDISFSALGLTEAEKKTCFFSVQSLKTDIDDYLKFVFNGADLTPHKAKIISVGKRKKEEKRLVFEYQQKNLGSLFDFTFLHLD